MERTLYIRSNSGQIRYWKCSEEWFGLQLEFGTVGGEPTFKEEDIAEGKAGRDVEEQIRSRFNSRISKQLDKGYVDSLEKAYSMKPVNRLGFCKPMLAHKFVDIDMGIIGSRDIWVQKKLDGNRCLIHNDGTQTVAYTRNGKLFSTLDHILEGLDIPVGCTLDGELYIHGKMLQSIVSLVKRKQPGTSEVEYHVYDMISDDTFPDRYKALETILADNLNPSIKLVETLRIESENNDFSLPLELEKARNLGYEGLMIRSQMTYNRGIAHFCGYEDGKRSKSLIKVKAWLDDEFEVTDIVPSADGWAILVCKCKGGEFRVSCHGDVQYKTLVLRNKEDYIGKKVTAEFAYWTKDNKPFHPVAKVFRDYE